MSLINLFFTNLNHDIFNMMYMYGIVMTLQYKPWIPSYKYCNSTCKEKQLISVLKNFICVCYDKKLTMINILTCFIQSQIQFCSLVKLLRFHLFINQKNYKLSVSIIITQAWFDFKSDHFVYVLYITEENAVLKEAADDVIENKISWDSVTDKRLLILKDQIDQERANIKFLERKVIYN